MKTVIAVWCEFCSGPGWANNLMAYLVRNNDARMPEYSVEYLQPNEQPVSSRYLFGISADVNSRLVNEVQQIVDGKQQKATLKQG